LKAWQANAAQVLPAIVLWLGCATPLFLPFEMMKVPVSFLLVGGGNSNIFYYIFLTRKLGELPILTNIFQVG